RAAAHGAEDLKRQDPPCRRARILRARPRRGEAAGGMAAIRAAGGGRRDAAAAPRAARGARSALRRLRLGALRAAFLCALHRRGARPGRPTWRFGQRCARLFLWLCAIPLVVRGRENLPASGSYVVACNHTSYFDGAVLLAILPWHKSAFVAKRELREQFITRVFLGGLGARFVERFDVQKSAEHADELASAAREGTTLIVFPEGTLLRHTGLLPFRTGAFQTAVQAQVPVVPVSLRGVRSVLRDGTWYLRRSPIGVAIA